ncbi:MAG: hypothetical protein REI11_19060, partial [Patulibacter sp.]|nr:hypothetical protein [Patulibacter sp.]
MKRRRRFVAAIDLRQAPEARGMALLRIALAPIAYLEQNARAAQYESGIFVWVIGALVAYGLVTLWMSFVPGLAQRWPVLFALLDLVFAALLVHASGGIVSPLKFAFYVLPIGAALRLSPRLTAMWAVLSVIAYLAVTVRDPHTHLDRDADILFDDSLTLLWVSGAAIMLSALVGQRQRALGALAATRRALVQQTLDAEARERRRLAEVLHDDAIQNVLLARQELGDVERGVPGAAERTRAALDATSEQLRHEVFSMHPLGLERIGLGAVLRDLAETAGKRGGFEATVDVDPAAERCEAQELIGVTARELLGNVAKHAGASRVGVRVAATDGRIDLTVTDDG